MRERDCDTCKWDGCPMCEDVQHDNCGWQPKDPPAATGPWLPFKDAPKSERQILVVDRDRYHDIIWWNEHFGEWENYDGLRGNGDQYTHYAEIYPAPKEK